jgi:hypothetical protein
MGDLIVRTPLIASAVIVLATLTVNFSLAQNNTDFDVVNTNAADREANGNNNNNAGSPLPAPRNADGRVVMGGATSAQKGVWTPMFGLSTPAAPYDNIPFQPWAQALYDARQLHELEPHARCKASGTARQFLTPYGVEFLELNELSTMYIFDIGGPHTYRTIYMDGRSHPADFEPTNYGHSIGWWDGDTLVVDSIGFNEDFWFERRGIPHTEQMHIVEYFTRISNDRTEYRFTIDDPGGYTAPYHGGFNLRWNEGVELFEYVCQQANYAHELMVGQESTGIDRSQTITP